MYSLHIFPVVVQIHHDASLWWRVFVFSFLAVLYLVHDIHENILNNAISIKFFYWFHTGTDSYILQAIARQCLEALAYLHSLGIIHSDLKPENVLIKSYSRCEIKVIDLGSSCFETDNLCLYVQSRSYRAPEVILGLPYGPKIDIWSLGCIMAELCSGEVICKSSSFTN